MQHALTPLNLALPRLLAFQMHMATTLVLNSVDPAAACVTSLALFDHHHRLLVLPCIPEQVPWSSTTQSGGQLSIR
jgi:hypothetical protein